MIVSKLVTCVSIQACQNITVSKKTAQLLTLIIIKNVEHKISIFRLIGYTLFYSTCTLVTVQCTYSVPTQESTSNIR